MVMPRPAWKPAGKKKPRRSGAMAAVWCPESGVGNPLDPGAQALEPGGQVFVATFDLIDILDGAFTLGTQGGNDHGHAGPDVGRNQVATPQAGRACDDCPVGVAKNDLGAHGDEFVDKEHPGFKHLLVDEDGAFHLGGDGDDDAQQVWRETRPGSVIDLGDLAPEVALDAQFLVGADVDGVALGFPVDAQLAKAEFDHLEVLGSGLLDGELTPGDGGQTDEGPDFHEVGPDPEGTTLEFLDSPDVQDVGADSADLGAHGIEHVAQVLDMGFAGTVFQDGGALGQAGGHDGVLGGRDTGLVHEDFQSDQFVGLEFVGTVDIHPGAQGSQGQEVGVQPPAADDIAARWGQDDLAGAGDHGTRQQDGCPDLAGQVHWNLGGLDVMGLDFPFAGL